MTNEQIEAVVWLMLEYDANKGNINAQGLLMLVEMRSVWNIKRAQGVLLKDDD